MTVKLPSEHGDMVFMVFGRVSELFKFAQQTKEAQKMPVFRGYLTIESFDVGAKQVSEHAPKHVKNTWRTGLDQALIKSTRRRDQEYRTA